MTSKNANIYSSALPSNTKTAAAAALSDSNGMDSSVFLTNALKISKLSPSRDLTLGGRGGSGAAKKVFTPNLNVVRNKNNNVKTSKDTTNTRGRGRGRGRGKAERGGGRGGANSTLIQTTGVFSEGAGAVQLMRRSASSAFGRNADEAPSAMRKPMIIKSEFSKIDLKTEAAHVKEMLGDSDDDDFEEEEKTDSEQIPVKLNEAKWKHVKPEIKLEPPDHTNETNGDVHMHNDESAVAVAQKMQALHVQQLDQRQQLRLVGSTPRFPRTVEEMLQTTTPPQIFLMQLPDALPCMDLSCDINDKESETKADMETDAATKTPATKKSTPQNGLKDLEEGKIGKLLRYKSGKMKLVLGDSYFDLNMGMETGFLQDLMSIRTNREERSGNMINLGPIQAKLTATPDWERLLEPQTRQDSS